MTNGGEHELVLFDIDRQAEIKPVMNRNTGAVVSVLLVGTGHHFSLSHVVLPFPPDAHSYGGRLSEENPGIGIVDLALRGERGVPQTPASELPCLRRNPFYAFVEHEPLDFVGLDKPEGSGGES